MGHCVGHFDITVSCRIGVGFVRQVELYGLGTYLELLQGPIGDRRLSLLRGLHLCLFLYGGQLLQFVGIDRIQFGKQADGGLRFTFEHSSFGIRIFALLADGHTERISLGNFYRRSAGSASRSPFGTDFKRYFPLLVRRCRVW